MTVIFSLWLAFGALAESSATDAQLKILLESRSASEVRGAAVVGSSLEILSQECELDLALKRVPVGCFAEARVRKANSLTSGEEHERKIRALTSLCRQTARTSGDFHSLKLALRSDSLFGSCRKAVEKRAEDLDYQLGEVRELDRFLK